MYLSSLHLSNFRSYELVDLDLDPGVTILVGSNGHGKTNVVEAIYYLSTLRSHRVASDHPLIRDGAQVATIRAKVHAGIGDDRALSLAIDIKQGMANKAVLGGSAVRPRELLGAVRSVVFSPEDLFLVQGDPAGRRGFLDDLVISRWPRLSAVKMEYDRSLKQKTALLKNLSGRSHRSVGAGARESLHCWNEEIVRSGAELLAARLRTLDEIHSMIKDNYSRIAPTSAVASVRYQSSCLPPTYSSDVGELTAVLRDALETRGQEELTRGVCLVGPHRDDLGLSLGELPARGYASHGESWSFALALKLASLDLLRSDGVEPILILDDVFAELDEYRRSTVVEAIDTTEQSFITVAVRQDIPSTLQGRQLAVTPGTITETPTIRETP
ncbi:MAG: DNA replication/repair protein RecF [Propionibacteriaceae bacterium]|nr:DNA replication/repair protein RecF [Propionibacteriaceae bacterium]